MKITNNLKLPKQLMELVNSSYKPTPQQYSCTTILKPTRQIILERRYGELIEQDVSDMCWMIFGIAVHSVIENAKEDEGQFKEETLKVDLGKYWEELKGYYLSGRSDLIDLIQKQIVDWKTCSAWKVIYKDFEDWRKEMLIYAWAVKDIGFDINKAEAIAFIKDHNKTKAKTSSEYPKLPIWVEKFKFTEKQFNEIAEFIYNKFIELKNNENTPDDELPMCTESERWREPTKYAVKKKANKTATKLHDTLEDAKKHLDSLEEKFPKIYEIEIREGSDKKCLEYCSCCKFCKYYQDNYMNENEIEKIEVNEC